MSSYTSATPLTMIDLENGDFDATSRAEKVTVPRRSMTKIALAVAGIAGVASIGAIMSTSHNYQQETGYAAAATSRMLEATIDTEPTATDSLTSTLPPTYLSIDGWENCLSVQSIGTSTQYCLPSLKPSACLKLSWGSLTAENMEISVCPSTKKTPNVKAMVEQKKEDTDKYKQDLDRFVTSHQAEIDDFLDDNKDAVSDVQSEIEKSITNETFDFKHYKEQIQKLVDEHDMKDYQEKLKAFMDSHRQEIDDFVTANMPAVSDVKDKISDAIKTGNFDFEHYQNVIQGYVDDFDIEKYKLDMDNFVSTHKAEIEEFIDDNKDAVNDVMDQITDRVNKGSFDFENYKQEIQDLVTKFDLSTDKENI